MMMRYSTLVEHGYEIMHMNATMIITEIPKASAFAMANMILFIQ